MNSLGRFFAGPIGSWVRVFAATALTLWLADLTQKGWSLDWSAYALAGLVAILPPIIAALNPADPRFGAGAVPTP